MRVASPPSVKQTTARAGPALQAPKIGDLRTSDSAYRAAGFPGASTLDTQAVDYRVKTFADEAVRQLDFLKRKYGVAGPPVDHEARPGTAVSVSYRRGDVTIEASLVLW